MKRQSFTYTYISCLAALAVCCSCLVFCINDASVKRAAGKHFTAQHAFKDPFPLAVSCLLYN